jgi:alpha-beta hydrolase superfamily lysophospholipase
MGNGIMLDSFPKFSPKPSCVVVASAFTSLRDIGARGGTSRLVLFLVPDVWNNVENISSVDRPLLVVHSDADTANPLEMGERIFRAAKDPKQMHVLHGFRHNDLYQNPTEAWWGSVLQFLEGENNPPTPAGNGLPTDMSR